MRIKRTCHILVVISISIAIALFFLQNATATQPTGETNHNTVNDTIDNYSEALNYAYMDIATADPSIINLILSARNQIIHSTSWVSDDVNGRIRDASGNVIYELPHFHDIFPDDWEEPVYPTE